MSFTRVCLYEAGKLIFLKALTPLHAGLGRIYGEAVDLPIQRDEFGIPVIWGSSLKGAIKSQKVLNVKDENVRPIVDVVFGPEEGSETASSVSILDARLLLIPVRSLRGLYAYVTSNHLLQYLKNYIDIVKSCTEKSNISEELSKNLEELINEAKNISEGKAIAVSDKCVIPVNGSGKVILNEQIYDVDVKPQLRDRVAKCFEKVLSNDEIDRVILVSDYDIYDIIRTSISVITRVRIRYETKTVEEGPWSEEYLPMGTVLVSAILYSRPRILKLCGEREHRLSEKLLQICKMRDKFSDVEKIWQDFVNPGEYLLVGGHETIGKGLVKISVV